MIWYDCPLFCVFRENIHVFRLSVRLQKGLSQVNLLGQEVLLKWHVSRVTCQLQCETQNLFIISSQITR